jgi:hypothetical protein
VRVLSAFILLANLMLADTVTLRDGRTVTGSYLGGDARNVRMAVGDRVESIRVDRITNITFGDDGVANAAPPPPPAPPPPRRDEPRYERQADRAPGADLPSGTVLTVRMIDSVDSERDRVGQTFRASLDKPVVDPSGNTLIARGAPVIVKLVDDQQSGKIAGRTILTLDLVSIEANGRVVDVDTQSVEQQSGSRTARSGKVIGGTAALGAIIGAIAGGGKGAAIGAGAGAGAGTVAQVATKGQRVHIPSETQLTFTLQQPVRL